LHLDSPELETTRIALNTSDRANRPLREHAAPPRLISDDAHRDSSLDDLTRQIARALVSQDDLERETAFETLLPELIARDASAATRLFETCDIGPVCEELLRRTVRTWTTIDIEHALHWIPQLPEDDRRLAAQEMTEQIARYDPAGAIEVADRFHLGRDDGTLEHLAQLWADESLPAALSWIAAQPAGSDRDQLLARVTAVQARTSPLEAMRMIRSYMTPSPISQAAMLSVLSEWAQRDFDAATSWAQQVSDATLRERATDELRRIATLSRPTE
jgi:hypothetical protein